MTADIPTISPHNRLELLNFFKVSVKRCSSEVINKNDLKRNEKPRDIYTYMSSPIQPLFSDMIREKKTF